MLHSAIPKYVHSHRAQTKFQKPRIQNMQFLPQFSQGLIVVILVKPIIDYLYLNIHAYKLLAESRPSITMVKIYRLLNKCEDYYNICKITKMLILEKKEIL